MPIHGRRRRASSRGRGLTIRMPNFDSCTAVSPFRYVPTADIESLTKGRGLRHHVDVAKAGEMALESHTLMRERVEISIMGFERCREIREKGWLRETFRPVD